MLRSAPFSVPRSLYTTVDSFSPHHAPSCRAREQVFLPGRSGCSAPLLSQLRGSERRERKGVLVAVTGGRLAGLRGGSSVPKMGPFRGADNRLEPGGI